MKPRTVIIALLLGMLLMFPSCGEPISKIEEIESGQSRAEPILAAIERYRQDNGVYPALLQELVPGYIGAIPKTVTGRNYEYQLDTSAGGYMLCYQLASQKRVTCCYLPGLSFWDCSMGVD